MKIFKFARRTPFPEIYFFSETLLLSHSFDYEILYKAYIEEFLGLHAIGAGIYNYALEEFLNLSSKIGWFEALLEHFNLSDLVEQWGWGDFFEHLQLQDSSSQRMVYSISLTENIGLVEAGSFGLANVDYRVTWRSRSREPLVGYGKAGYGIEAGYGTGDCADLKQFKVRIYTMPAHTLKRTVTITIVDTQNPDDDAEYVYTSAFNIADNGTFNRNLRFEVTQINQSDVESPVAYIDIEPIPF